MEGRVPSVIYTLWRHDGLPGQQRPLPHHTVELQLDADGWGPKVQEKKKNSLE